MSLRIDDRGATIADVIIERVGNRPGLRLIAFLQAFDLLRDELGHPPSTDEYATRYGLSPATAYRDRQLFERAFPGQAPEQVLDLLWSWHDSRGGGALMAARVSDGEHDEIQAIIDRVAGSFTYPPGYLDALRDEWER